MSTSTALAPARGPAPDGPPLVPVIGVTAALFVLSLVLPVLAGRGFPGAEASPFAPSGVRASYVLGESVAGGWSAVGAAVLQVAAAFPLLIFTAAVHARLHRLGIRVAGATIALAGGVWAAAFLAVCGLARWVLARLDVEEARSLGVALADLAFAAGGPVHVAGLGLLTAGIAVPGLLVRLLPRWFALGGWVLAALCELSVFALAVPALAYLLPVRFAVLAWLVAAAALLPRDRREVPRPVTGTR